MNKSLFIEMLKGLKWVILALAILAAIVASWWGIAWSLGWYIDKIYNLSEFNSGLYVQFGSSVLVFTVIVQIITLILFGWILIAWGKSQGSKGK